MYIYIYIYVYTYKERDIEIYRYIYIAPNHRWQGLSKKDHNVLISKRVSLEVYLRKKTIIKSE